MIEHTSIPVGTRVRLRSASHVVDLRSDTGRVVRTDPYDGLPVIHLDEPALYREADGTTRELPELVQSTENLEILDSVDGSARKHQ